MQDGPWLSFQTEPAAALPSGANPVVADEWDAQEFLHDRVRGRSRGMMYCSPRLSPEILEPIRREFGVLDGVLDIPVAKIRLQGASCRGRRWRGRSGLVPEHVGRA